MKAACSILDEDHLARQTFGDAVLEREVVGLFADQLRRFSTSLERADATERGAILHGVKGSARAVGAMALAQRAEEMEGDGAAGPEGLQDVLAATLSALAARGK